jgi:hypothetical protein
MSMLNMLMDKIKHIVNTKLTDYVNSSYNNEYFNKQKIICIIIGIIMIYILLRITSIFIIIIGGFILGLYIFEVYRNTIKQDNTVKPLN